MSAFESLLGSGSAARQLLIYGVGYEIARSLLGPMFTQIEYGINANSPLIELSPPELADLVIRGVIGNEPDAAARARVYGLDSSKFQELVRLAGEPPGLVQVLEWWRRGHVPWDQGIGQPSVAEAIRTSRIYTYWTDVIQHSQFVPPGPAEAVDAVQRNQITYDQGMALAFFAGLGVDALAVPAGADTAQTRTAFDVMLHTRGNPPSVGELLELAKRRFIPWGNLDPATKSPNPDELSFAQGIYEGDSKDKWLPMYARLAEYLPPPRTILAMIRSGALDTTTGTDLLRQAGLPDNLIAVYLAEASHTKTAGPKQLNVSAIEQLFVDKLVDQPTAHNLLVQIGYQPSEADLLLTSADLRQTMAELKQNINRVGTQYINHRIDATTAASLLGGLGLPAAQITQTMNGWDVDRFANLRRLSAAQIVSAHHYNIITTDQAMAYLEADGWGAYQSWVLLSEREHGPLPNPPPPPGPAGV